MSRNSKKDKYSSNNEGSSASNTANFNSDDREKLHEIYSCMKKLESQVHELKAKLNDNNEEMLNLKAENIKLKQALSLNVFNVDALEQYGRRENLRIHGSPESKEKQDDGENIVFELAKELKIDLKSSDIQRAHRLGKKKKTADAKPRQVIVRFLSYKKRNEFLKAKSRLRDSKYFPDAFITEDITPLRSKLLHYVKNKCGGKFVLCHTINGRIRMKKSAKYEGKIGNNEKDEGIGDWITISTPDDLFKHNIDVDFQKLNYLPLLFNDDANCKE